MEAVALDLKIPSSDLGSDGAAAVDSTARVVRDIEYEAFSSEAQLPIITALIANDLSEPYSVYTYRYFLHSWPHLSYLAMDGEKCVGTIVCKLERHKSKTYRGYIAMLAVDPTYRKRRIGTTLVEKAVTAMKDGGADEIVLETEVTNPKAIALYEKIGFARDKMLFRYYLNGVDAIRLKLWLK